MGYEWTYHCDPEDENLTDEELIDKVFGLYCDAIESSQQMNECMDCKYLEHYGCFWIDSVPPCFEKAV